MSTYPSLTSSAVDLTDPLSPVAIFGALPCHTFGYFVLGLGALGSSVPEETRGFLSVIGDLLNEYASYIDVKDARARAAYLVVQSHDFVRSMLTRSIESPYYRELLLAPGGLFDITPFHGFAADMETIDGESKEVRYQVVRVIAGVNQYFREDSDQRSNKQSKPVMRRRVRFVIRALNTFAAMLLKMEPQDYYDVAYQAGKLFAEMEHWVDVPMTLIRMGLVHRVTPVRPENEKAMQDMLHDMKPHPFEWPGSVSPLVADEATGRIVTLKPSNIGTSTRGRGVPNSPRPVRGRPRQ